MKRTETKNARTPGAAPILGAAGALLAVLALPASAAAHDVPFDGANPWTVWEITPDIVLGTLLVAALYTAGLWRLRHRLDTIRFWRHVAFYAGLAMVFLALQSPIDPIAEHVFAIHQVQHLLIRMIGPMLLFLAAPQAVLVAGTPGPLQRGIVAPVITSRAVRGTFSIFAHPVMVTVLFIAALYFWQIPEYHNLALLNDGMHYLMHVTMLIAGLIFFWRVFDMRAAPQGTRHGVRLMMLWATIMSNILLGSYLVFKGSELYPAYDTVGRLWHMSALTDEVLGGALIWIPSSMMGVVAVLIVIHMLGHHEAREDDRRRAEEQRLRRLGHNRPPLMAADVIQRAAPKNRVMALGMTAFVIAVFMTSIAIGMISHAIGARALHRRSLENHATRGRPVGHFEQASGPLHLTVAPANH